MKHPLLIQFRTKRNKDEKCDDFGEFMKLDKSDRIQLACEKCGTALNTDAASRSILSDGQVHVFCQDCTRHMLIIKDGSLNL